MFKHEIWDSPRVFKHLVPNSVSFSTAFDHELHPTIDNRMSIIKLTEASTSDQFKHVLLSILVASTYVSKYTASLKPTDTGSKSGAKKSDPTPIQGTISQLRDHVIVFNQDHAKPDETGKKKVDKNVGGGNSVRKFYNCIKEDDLKTCLNQATGTLLPLSLFSRAAEALNMPVKLSPTSADYIKHINTFGVAQSLISHAFPYACRYSCKLTSQSNKPFATIADFLSTKNSDKTLKTCTIQLLEPLRIPEKKAEITDRDDTDAETLKNPDKTESQNAERAKSTSPPERCIGHYLNFDRLPVWADTQLIWQDAKLIGVRMQQRQPFRNGSKHLYTFEATRDRIIEGGKTMYVLLTAKEQPGIELQITIEKTSDSMGQRNGLYTFLKHKEEGNNPAVPFGGLVVLQTVPADMDIKQFEQDLTHTTASAPEPQTPRQTRLANALRIRYRILDQLATLPKSVEKPEPTAWTKLQLIVGSYACYYMRLSKSPAKFETSQIQIFPDGQATLKQQLDERGVYRLCADEWGPALDLFQLAPR